MINSLSPYAMKISHKSDVSVLFWNIDGLYSRVGNLRVSKFSNDDVYNSLLKHDIICLAETHCGPKDDIDLEGYQVFPNFRPRSKNAKKHSGGLAIYVKNNLRQGIKILPTTNSEYMWIKLDKQFFKLENDIYLANAYVCPQNSSYSSKTDDIMELLERDIAHFSKLGKILLCGDFNARTNSACDYCVDDNIDDLLDLPYDYIQDVPLARNNADTSQVNQHGESLLNLCKSTGIRIINGRLIGDSTGFYTCLSPNGAPSVIDYMLASEEIFPILKFFHVNDPTPQSIHNSLSLSIKTSIFKLTTRDKPKTITPNKLIWNSGDEWKLTQQLKLPSTIEAILKLRNKDQNCTQEFVDGYVNDITAVITQVSQNANIRTLSKKGCKKKKQKQNKPWFNQTCQQMKNNLLKMASRIRNNLNDQNLIHQYKRLRKSYKQSLKRSKRNYDRMVWDKLSSLQNSNPKAFWETLNKFRNLDATHKENPISAEEWKIHFAKLLNLPHSLDQTHREHVESFIKQNRHSIFNELNFQIKASEILESTSSLKNKKACGIDGIPNEILKTCVPPMIEPITKLFNSILTNGLFPKQWTVQTLSPLHKKGTINNPDNHRGIAIGNGLAKIFLQVLQKRLTSFSEKNKLIPTNQIGYKKGSRTTDHILTLKNIIDKYILQIPRRYLYVCFIDFKSAFDSVWRSGLFYKLIKVGIGGCFLNTLISMYKSVRYAVKVNGDVYEPFDSQVGVKQGCVMSPLLFNLYLSDFPDIFDSTCEPVMINNTSVNCLMFADDIVIMSESAQGLQNCLDKVSTYCNLWGLTVNIKKTNVIIFNKGGHKISRFKFFLGENEVSIVNQYSYLGVIFSSCGSFTKAINALTDKAKKAFFRLRQLDPKNDVLLTIKLFDMLVTPILSYSCEIWAPFTIKRTFDIMSICDKQPYEKLNVKLCKYILGVGKHATNAAVLGELGRYPLTLKLFTQSIKFFDRIGSETFTGLAKDSFKESFNAQANAGPAQHTWAHHISLLLNNSNHSHVWSAAIENQSTSIDAKVFHEILLNKYASGWYNHISRDSPSGNKLRTFVRFKKSFKMEHYILSCEPTLRKNFTKLRISAHKLDIEMGRYAKPKVAPENRKCQQCSLNKIEDEFHMFMECPFYAMERNKFVSELEDFTTFDFKINKDVFYDIMSSFSGDPEICKIICSYVNACFMKRFR